MPPLRTKAVKLGALSSGHASTASLPALYIRAIEESELDDPMHTVYLKVTATAFALVVVGALVTFAAGVWSWRFSTAKLVDRLNETRAASSTSHYDADEVAGLPAPVARYFHTVLRDGQPFVVSACFAQTGTFRLGDGDDTWKPFNAMQTCGVTPPAFVWDARIRMMPALDVDVCDGYVDTHATMRGRVGGVFTVIDAQDSADLEAGALQRHLAECVWFPTALLSSQGVRWTAIDDKRALATLTDGQTSVSLEFRFAPTGEIVSAFTPSRSREVNGRFVATPWECHYGDYAERDGMRIPFAGEVEWQMPDRRLPYWRGNITGVTFTFAP
jgi:hypothetical protein